MRSDRVVEELKSRLDIVDLVSEHVDLKRAGQNFKGLCPFHSEKSPSFMVNQAKQMFHCFGCNKGGDMFAFIMDYDNMTFPEAVSYLADKAGIEIEQYSGGPDIKKGLKEGLLAVYREAASYYKENLTSAGQACAYLKGRGLEDEIIDRFSLGYAGSGREALHDILKEKGFPKEHIKASGLVYFGENGTHDFFRDRIMFPIQDLQGKVIALGGRTMSSSKNIPKYLNSPDSPIFRKGETCFALDLAKGRITEKGYSIIVEGYLDVIMCHQHGFENTVAPLGTALTTGHLRKLKRFADKTVLVFDGDAAGIAASRRSISIVFSEGLTAKVLLLPEGEDPDTFLRKHGKEQFGRRMGKAFTSVEFLFKTSATDKLDTVRQILSIVAACRDTLQRDQTLNELSDRSGINEPTLREELKQVIGRAKTLGNRSSSAPSAGRALHMAIKNKDEEILLNIALTMPGKLYVILHGVEPEHLEHPLIREVFGKMKTALDAGRGKDPDPADLFGILDGEERTFIAKYSLRPDIDEEKADANIEDCLQNIALKSLDRKIKEAEREAVDSGDANALQSLLLAKKELNLKKRH
jgi:DNA primase